MMQAVGIPWHRITAAELRRDLVHVAKRPAALAVIEFAQRAAPHFRRRRTGIDRGGVGFAGVIDVTVVCARPGRVCTAGFISKCFSTSTGNKSSLRSRIAFPHTDARERFNCFEICAADACGQRPMSREISWVVQGIIANLASSP